MNISIVEQYRQTRDSRKEFLASLAKEIKRTLRDGNFKFVDVPYRVKREASLIQKLRNPKWAFKTIDEVHDVCGLRIITYLREDIELAFDLLKDVFDVTHRLERKPEEPTQFGYLSVHAQIRFRDAHPKKSKDWSGYYAEIQVRTVLQHAWAEIEHDLGYKNEVGPPEHLKRRFALLSALLEIGDREFDELKRDVDKYILDVAEQPIDALTRRRVDVHTLLQFVASSSLVTQIMDVVRENVGVAKVVEHDFLPAASALDYLDIAFIGDLASTLETERHRLPPFMSHFLKSANFAEVADGAAIDFLALYISASRSYENLHGMLKTIAPSGSDEGDRKKAESVYEYFEQARAVNGTF